MLSILRKMMLTLLLCALLAVTIVSQSVEEYLCLFCHPKTVITSSSVENLKLAFGFDIATSFIHFSRINEAAYVINRYRDDFTILTPESQNGNMHWDTPFLEERPEIAAMVNQGWLSVAEHPTQSVIALGGLDGTIELWNLDTGASMHRMDVTSPVPDMVFWQTGNDLIMILDHHKVARYSLADDIFQWLTLPDDVDYVSNLSVSADGEWLAVSGDNNLLIWSYDYNMTEVPASSDAIIRQIVFSPLDPAQMVTIADSIVTLWTTQDKQWEITRTFQVPALTLKTIERTSAVISPDNSLLLVAYDNDQEEAQLFAWETSTGNLINVISFSIFEGNLTNVYDMDISPGGLWLAISASGATPFFIIP